MTNNPIMFADGQFHELLVDPPIAAELAPAPVPADPPMFLSMVERRP
jgi:hypothetical protein